MRTNAGADFQSKVMGGGTLPTNSVARQPYGSCTSAGSATTLPDVARTWVANEWAGQYVVAGSVYGVILSNTPTVLTIDKWYQPNDPAGAAGTPPASASAYSITPGGAPGWWIGVSTASASPNAADTTLVGEMTGANGLARALASYAHTTSMTTYTLVNTFTSVDSVTRSIEKIGVFNASNGGTLVFETAVTSPPPLATGDAVTITETVTI